jgi:hypothetical protein
MRVPVPLTAHRSIAGSAYEASRDPIRATRSVSLTIDAATCEVDETNVTIGIVNGLLFSALLWAGGIYLIA